MPSKVSSIEYAEAWIASLYICPHRDCRATPYVGDLYGCSSHLRRVHFRTCLICPYCPNQRYYRASGWKAHMSSKHSLVPWFSAPEATQASLMLASVQEDISALGSSQEPTGVKAEVPLVQLPRPEEISTIPLCPTQEEDPLEESLPFAPDAAKEDLTPEQEQELLEEGGMTPRPPTPSDKAIIEATRFAPSNLRAYEYAGARGGGIMSRYPKSRDHSQELAIALVKQDLPAMSDDPPEVLPAKKSKSDDDANDGAPSM